MSGIVFTRQKSSLGALREYKIYVDGQKVETLLNGESKKLEILPGPHTIKINVDWVGSQELPVVVKEGEYLEYIVSETKNAGVLVPLSIGLVFASLFLKDRVDADLLWLFMLPAVIMIVYLLTIGKNKYLLLRKAAQS